MSSTTKPSGLALAKTPDNTISITITIPWSEIEKTKAQVVASFQKDFVAPGFRKGKVPLTKVEEGIDPSKLREQILSKLLPEKFGAAVVQFKIKPAIYPRFEIVKADPDTNWEVVAQTAEMPVFELGDYKKTIATSVKSVIWTPDSKEKPKEAQTEEKISRALEALLTSINITIPAILVAEEVNSRLSKLLARLEKLGLSLESYLASINKSADQLRHDYEADSQKAIMLDLILNRIAQEEKFEATEEEIDKAIKNSKAESADANQKALIASLVKRQKVIDLISSLL